MPAIIKTRDIVVDDRTERVAKAFHERHRKLGLNSWEEMSPRNRNYWRDEALFAIAVATIPEILK